MRKLLDANELVAWSFANYNLMMGPSHGRREASRVEKGMIRTCSSNQSHWYEGPPYSFIGAAGSVAFAVSSWLCRVKLSGAIVSGTSIAESSNALGASTFEVLWVVDASDVLWEVSRWAALSCSHLWDMPSITKEYLGIQHNPSVRKHDELREKACMACWGKYHLADEDKSCLVSVASDACASPTYTAAWQAARGVFGCQYVDRAVFNAKLTEAFLQLSPDDQP